MAPTDHIERRTTRPSTRSQTKKSASDVQANSSTKITKRNAGVTKGQKKSAYRASAALKAKPAKPASQAAPTTTQSHSTLEDQDGTAADGAASLPDSVIIFNISTPLLKKPITCHQYTSGNQGHTSPSPDSYAPFIFTHGAGGTLLAPAVLNFCTGFSSVSSVPLIAFQGSMNLGTRVKAARSCFEHALTEGGIDKKDEETVFFGGRSMGARAAVIAATELLSEGKVKSARLVLVSYPLQGPKDVRDQILLDLPKEVEVLFIVGDRDAMCPLDLLEGVRGKMACKSRVVMVRGADHGMNVKPQSKMREIGEETGRMAASIGFDGKTLYIGEEEET